MAGGIRVSVLLSTVAGTLSFFPLQNQLYALPYNICPCLVVLFAVFLKSFIRFCINPGLDFNVFGLFQFGAACPWRHIITHFLSHNKYNKYCGSKSQEVFQKYFRYLDMKLSRYAGGARYASGTSTEVLTGPNTVLTVTEAVRTESWNV